MPWLDTPHDEADQADWPLRSIWLSLAAYVGLWLLTACERWF